MRDARPEPQFLDRRSLCVTTFQEAGEADRAFWQSQTPLDRLRHLEILRELT